MPFPNFTGGRASWNAAAGKDGRVYLIADEKVLLPGSRVAGMTEEIARLLHPGGTAEQGTVP